MNEGFAEPVANRTVPPPSIDVAAPAVRRLSTAGWLRVALTVGGLVCLGVVEGVTEYLPVSSTGHLALTERVPGIGNDPASRQAADSYMVVVQGAPSSPSPGFTGAAWPS